MGFWKRVGRGIMSPVKLVGKAATTVALSTAYVATAGQCKGVTNALVKSAKSTGKEFMKSDIRHVGEGIGMMGATVGCTVAKVATLGKCKAVNKAAKKTAKGAVKSFKKSSPIGKLAFVAVIGAGGGALSAVGTNAITGGAAMAVGESAIAGAGVGACVEAGRQINKKKPKDAPPTKIEVAGESATVPAVEKPPIFSNKHFDEVQNMLNEADRSALTAWMIESNKRKESRAAGVADQILTAPSTEIFTNPRGINKRKEERDTGIQQPGFMGSWELDH